MPMYDYTCSECSETFERRLPYSEIDAPTTEACPKCGEKKLELNFPSPALGDPIRLGIKRPDQGFTEVLRKIKVNNPGSTIGNQTKTNIPRIV